MVRDQMLEKKSNINWSLFELMFTNFKLIPSCPTLSSHFNVKDYIGPSSSSSDL